MYFLAVLLNNKYHIINMYYVTKFYNSVYLLYIGFKLLLINYL